jgi:hypothetical protein
LNYWYAAISPLFHYAMMPPMPLLYIDTYSLLLHIIDDYLLIIIITYWLFHWCHFDTLII